MSSSECTVHAYDDKILSLAVFDNYYQYLILQESFLI